MSDDDDIRNAADLIAALERAHEEWSQGLREAQAGGPGWDVLREKFREQTRLSRRLCDVLRSEGCLHRGAVCYSLDTHGRLLRRHHKDACSVELTSNGGPDLPCGTLDAATEAEERSC